MVTQSCAFNGEPVRELTVDHLYADQYRIRENLMRKSSLLTLSRREGRYLGQTPRKHALYLEPSRKLIDPSHCLDIGKGWGY